MYEYMSQSELEDYIGLLRSQVKFYSLLSKDDPFPGGYGTVGVKLRDLKERLKIATNELKEREYKRECYWAERRAQQVIFDRENDGIYPSDIGQDWHWKVEDGIVYVTIEGKEYSEPVIYPER